jgi:hypothetical protein
VGAVPAPRPRNQGRLGADHGDVVVHVSPPLGGDARAGGVPASSRRRRCGCRKCVGARDVELNQVRVRARRSAVGAGARPPLAEAIASCVCSQAARALAHAFFFSFRCPLILLPRRCFVLAVDELFLVGDLEVPRD